MLEHTIINCFLAALKILKINLNWWLIICIKQWWIFFCPLYPRSASSMWVPTSTTPPRSSSPAPSDTTWRTRERSSTRLTSPPWPPRTPTLSGQTETTHRLVSRYFVFPHHCYILWVVGRYIKLAMRVSYNGLCISIPACFMNIKLNGPWDINPFFPFS